MTESLYVPCLFHQRVKEKGLVLIAVATDGFFIACTRDAESKKRRFTEEDPDCFRSVVLCQDA